ncbi:FHA domain-containing protein [Nonomuraea sediminis]|uniref:FHA domain-containing protein n=1 Tax=Nonomuraea sediminis TaxID=2835864 RepID=UPI001BDBB789|nr:FHA domain-containing protein [Nonomuraea sediminis]
MTDQGFGVVRPLPGKGLVAHTGGLLLVCDETEAAGTDLLEALRETAASGGDGRVLARRAAQVLAANMADDPVTCAVAGPVGSGFAVLVSGSAAASVSTDEGETRLAGSDSMTWADRLISGPVHSVRLSLPDAGEPHPAVRLDGGVVPGGGIVCDLSDAGPAPSRPATMDMPNTARFQDPELIQPSPPPYPMPEPPISVQGPPPQDFAAGPPSQDFAAGPPSQDFIAGPPSQDFVAGPPSGPQPPIPQDHPPFLPPQEPPPLPPQPGHFPSYDDPPAAGTVPEQFEPAQQPPMEQHFDQPPMGPPDQGPMGPQEHFEQPGPPSIEQEQQGDRPLVYGVDCKNDHFNDPRAPYCAVCGIALVQRTLVPYRGPRPSLGVLILDDGMALPLEADYLLGRDPERAPEVADGSARPAKVTSPDGSVSRRHLRVRLNGWDVNLVDLGSVNGTQIQPPGDPNFYDIPPNEDVTIAPGTTVRVGVSRTMRFEGHRG